MLPGATDPRAEDLPDALCYAHDPPRPMKQGSPRIIPGAGMPLQEWVECDLCGAKRPTGRVKRRNGEYEIRRRA